MEIHHTKHHASYTVNLNAALQGYPDLQGISVESLLADLNNLPEGIQTAVPNYGGGFANHNLFWSMIAPGANDLDAASMTVRRAAQSAFGDYDKFSQNLALQRQLASTLASCSMTSRRTKSTSSWRFRWMRW